MISERTKTALAAAQKTRGQLGNPRLADARAVACAALEAEADAHADVVMPAICEAQATGAKSLRQIVAALNGRGVATARAGKCEAATMRNILRRAARWRHVLMLNSSAPLARHPLRFGDWAGVILAASMSRFLSRLIARRGIRCS